MRSRPRAPETVAVAAGRPAATPGGPLNSPITLASALVPGGDSEYARHGNPTWTDFEAALGALEGGRALAFASGMAATTALLELVPPGGTVVAAAGSYYGTTSQLSERVRRGQVDLRLVDVTDTEAVVRASEDAALLWLESPTNPGLDVADIRTIASTVSAAGTAVAVDNTFATPLRQKPLELGADFVVHSASKLIAGHSDVVLGAVVTNDDRAYRALASRRSSHGAIPGALETYLALRGLRTLHVRLDRAEQNARELSSRLALAPQVTGLRYPGFGTIIAFEVAAGPVAAQKMTEVSRLITYATSLGGVESTWERRRRHTNEPVDVPESLVRLSVGIEHVDDLWDDLAAALDVVG
ncbi:Cys/Met metabolism PLP-dependent enzyme [Aeromicrobium marinum DSM 15272]|uniref:homocysteine desulfhydrase n=1 Tax=Aeromicrobium marinum DSM 15272 TaxID=585531 RepID=E2SAZ9_9ACTN|nr:PLP-dependent transferase [Aeromicrobium marinum]EFQ83545.1 Cys/Met metabolism PLP-dependent enzyme [Aeromicrobium marinum DSM 15272]